MILYIECLRDFCGWRGCMIFVFLFVEVACFLCICLWRLRDFFCAEGACFSCEEVE